MAEKKVPSRPESGWKPLGIRAPNVESRDQSFIEKLNEMNRQTWVARNKWAEDFEADFPDAFRAVAADYASQFVDGTPKHRIRTFDELLQANESARKDGLIRQEGSIAAIGTVQAKKATKRATCQ